MQDTEFHLPDNVILLYAGKGHGNDCYRIVADFFSHYLLIWKQR